MTPFLDRRQLLNRTAGGMGLAALASLLADDGLLARDVEPPRPHFPAKATSAIFVYLIGGTSQIDLFDPKPELAKLHGKPIPESFRAGVRLGQTNYSAPVMQSPFKFRRYGKCGMELSDMLPEIGGCADDIALVRSMHHEAFDHAPGELMICTGKEQPGRPTMGSWLTYGLGSAAKDLPGYVVLLNGRSPKARSLVWGNGFLPATHQGTPFRAAGSPVSHLATPSDVSAAARRNQLDLLGELNAAHLRNHPGNAELEARLGHYELAAKMQTAIPDVLDISKETEETRKLYGIDNPKSAEYGKRCLLARRLVERGVRFVQIFLNGQPWDTHSKNNENLRNLTAMTDGPCAGLVMDLKRRGLLGSTIVMWTGEFGRLPISQGTDGRDHNRHAFSLWLAGGGFKKGYVHGATDDFGYSSVEKVVRVSGLHATLLHALGLDHTRLTFPHEGRDDTLTDVAVTRAAVVDDLLA